MRASAHLRTLIKYRMLSVMAPRSGSSGFWPQVALFALFMFTLFSITVLGVGLSGGKLLSARDFVRDVRTLNPGVFLRLVAWLILSAPLIWTGFLIGQWRARRRHGNGG